MTVIREEAQKKRARELYTIPMAIDRIRLDGLAEPCRTYLKTFYDPDGDQYKLNIPVSGLSDSVKFKILECLDYLNGIEMALVTLEPNQAILDVHFFNRNYFSLIISDFTAFPGKAHDQFPITGGFRIQAGPAEDQVRVVEVLDLSSSDSVLRLTVMPIGDYSTYRLGINGLKYPRIDPVFSEMDFKFRPGCFNIDCRPAWERSSEAPKNPIIDYLAKDYDSFRHTMMAAMSERVPGWQPTSEADLDQVLLELFSVAADELSDYQDRVMNEAYLGTSRKRVSIARHARLMDYHIHQGNRASTWLALRITAGMESELKPDFQAATTEDFEDSERAIFTARGLFCVGNSYQNELDNLRVSTAFKSKFKLHGIELSPNTSVNVRAVGSIWEIIDEDNRQIYLVAEDGDHLVVFADWYLNDLINNVKLYTWSDSQPALDVLTTQADLKIAGGEKAVAEFIRDKVRNGIVKHLLLQEWRDPATGNPAGADPVKRQLLELLSGDQAAETVYDPLEDEWLVRVRWRDEDALKSRFCFCVDCPEGKKDDVSLFHGNLIRVYHGRRYQCVFKDPGEQADSGNLEYHYERTKSGSVICRLPEGPLAYRETDPGGVIPPISTLEVSISVSPEVVDKYDEVVNLIHSDDTSEMGDHFVVETDELMRSLIRFGDGINGKELPDKAVVRCIYQIGGGLSGNIGADKLTYCNKKSKLQIEGCWNPFDVTNGRTPELPAEIVRRVPEAYLQRQLRAVTLKDYVERAEELDEVQRAHAGYAWAGSWRTVRITADLSGGSELADEVREKLAGHLNAVRLIGEDLEIRPPRPVPLDIVIELCLHPDFWPEDIKYLLEQEFSDGWTLDGRLAFFHPDLWTFGQGLRKSQIIGQVQIIEGVDHVITVTMKRFNEPTPGLPDRIEVGPTEIIQVKNDPDHMETGMIKFVVRGGRS